MSQRRVGVWPCDAQAPGHPSVRDDVQIGQEGDQERVPVRVHQPQGGLFLHLQPGQRTEAAAGKR